MKNIYIKSSRLTVIIFICLLGGCKKDPINWYRPIGSPMSSNVKFVNTLPGSRMDFYTYTAKVTSGIKYGDTTMPYAKTPYGNIIVYGTNFSNTSPRVSGTTTENNPQMGAQGLVAYYFQTMFACKVFATIQDSIRAVKNFDSAKVTKKPLPFPFDETMLLLRDDLTPPATGKSHIRFVHLAQAGKTSIKKVDFASSNGPTTGIIFPNLAFQKPSNSITGLSTPGVGVFTSGPYTPVDAGVYTFDVKEAATENILTTKQVNLVSGKIYTLYTVGTIGIPGSTSVLLKIISH